jgi:hypothetical protein
LSQALFLESFELSLLPFSLFSLEEKANKKKHFILAGLLTHSFFHTTFPEKSSGIIRFCAELNGKYSSGSVQDSHLIPFSSLFQRIRKRDTKTPAKV